MKVGLAHKASLPVFQRMITAVLQLVSAAEGETVAFSSSIVHLYEWDFDSDSLRPQLDMFPKANQTSGMKGGRIVSSVASAMNATPVAKALLPEVHKLFHKMTQGVTSFAVFKGQW